MSPDVKQFELDRIVNMLKSFTWTVVSSRIEGDKVIAQFQKVMPGAAADIKKFESDRITNMLSSFGWQVVSSEYPGDKVISQYSKVIKSEA